MAPKEVETIRDRGDLLRLPLIGRLLSNSKFVTTLQIFSLILFVVAIVRGYILPERKDNLFTTGLFWGLFWPLFIFITTPTLGKIICAVCPHRLLIFFFGNRFSLNKKPPKWMKSGFVSLTVVMLFYWILVYGWLDILHSPIVTAIYFTIFTIAAITVTLIYKPSIWCKGLCPIAIPTNLVSRIAFLGIRTYQSKCDPCKIATCVVGRPKFEGCPHNLNPSMLKSNSDCTLCMKCVNACSHDAVRFGFIRPLQAFKLKKFKSNMAEALGVLLLFAAIILTMQLFNGIYRGMMREKFPLAKLGKIIHPYVDYFFTIESVIALTTFLFAVAFILIYYYLFSIFAAKVTAKKITEVFGLLSWSLLPVFALACFAQMSEFFFFRYYPMIADGFLDLFNVKVKVSPLVSMNSIWLAAFKIISIAGGVWSIIFTWQLSERLSTVTSKRVIISTPFWFFYVVIMLGFVAQVVVMTLLDMPQVTGPRG